MLWQCKTISVGGIRIKTDQMIRIRHPGIDSHDRVGIKNEWKKDKLFNKAKIHIKRKLKK